MTSPARKIDRSRHVLIPGHRVPGPANDNRHHADFVAYVRNVRAQSGAVYQSSDAKLWWVP